MQLLQRIVALERCEITSAGSEKTQHRQSALATLQNTLSTLTRDANESLAGPE